MNFFFSEGARAEDAEITCIQLGHQTRDAVTVGTKEEGGIQGGNWRQDVHQAFVRH